MATEDEEFESELDNDDEGELGVAETLAEFVEKDLPDEIARIKELAVASGDGKLALSEIAETIIPMIADLAGMVAELADEHDEVADAVFVAPNRSVLLPADARLIVSALHHAYEWAVIVKNERAEKQDRVHEALEVVTELRVACERSLELVVDSSDVPGDMGADPLKVVRDIAGARVTKPAEPKEPKDE